MRLDKAEMRMKKTKKMSPEADPEKEEHKEIEAMKKAKDVMIAEAGQEKVKIEDEVEKAGTDHKHLPTPHN